MPRLLKVAEPLVEWAFRKEIVRILAELERYVEAQPKQCDREKAPGVKPTPDLQYSPFLDNRNQAPPHRHSRLHHVSATRMR